MKMLVVKVLSYLQCWALVESTPKKIFGIIIQIGLKWNIENCNYKVS